MQHTRRKLSRSKQLSANKSSSYLYISYNRSSNEAISHRHLQHTMVSSVAVACKFVLLQSSHHMRILLLIDNSGVVKLDVKILVN